MKIRDFFKVRVAILVFLALVSITSGCWALLNIGNEGAVSRHIVGSRSIGTIQNLGEQEEICRAADTPKHSLVIVVEGELFDTEGYPNLFQTADENYGIRAEINGGTAGLVVATDSGAFVGLPLGPVQANKKFKMLLRVSQGQFAAGSISDQGTATIEADLNPRCDRVLVGGGFSTDRNAKGRLRVDFWNETYRYSPKTLRLVRTIAMVSAILFLVVLMRRSPLDSESIKSAIGDNNARRIEQH